MTPSKGKLTETHTRAATQHKPADESNPPTAVHLKAPLLEVAYWKVEAAKRNLSLSAFIRQAVREKIWGERHAGPA